MIQYHAFKNGERNFLYLTKYKQLFLIPDNEYEKLVKPINMNDTNEIISFY
ncbi:MAG: hypothetical protein ACFWUA_08235 [Sporanaerobacter sp.]|uniref:hypothetical protein n=1 Tax=Sporanaerobacter sp. TaxID=2010183 RepID=UPI003A0FCE5E